MNIFNLRSPSSSRRCVEAIIINYVGPEVAKTRILDVGGTRKGFVKRIPQVFDALKDAIVIVNPDPKAACRLLKTTGRSFSDIADVTVGEHQFRLVMLFGTMMYLDEKEALSMFNRVRKLLGHDGTFLIAEPDPARISNKIDHLLKLVLFTITHKLPCVLRVPLVGPWLKSSLPKKLIAYSIAEVADLLFRAGFKVRVATELVPRSVYGRYYVLEATQPADV